MKLDAVLPWPPSVNHYWEKNHKGMHLGKAAQDFKTEAGFLLVRARPVGWPLGERYSLRLYCFPPDKRKRDLDNILKGIMDAGNKIVYGDDEQIDQLSVARYQVDKARPRVHLHLEAMKC